MSRQDDLTFPAADGRAMRASLALPEGAPGPHPAVLVIHEILGLNDDIRRIAARFADAGYVALAPDAFDGPGPRVVCLLRALRTVRQWGGPVADDLLAARDWLAARPDVDGSRIGVAGFCMGGGFALLLGTIGDFGAAAPFYGEVPHAAEAMEDICPVVAGYGARDLIFGKQGHRLEQHLETLGVPHDVRTYEGVGHSYMSRHGGSLFMRLGELGPLRAGYDDAAAEDSWERMLAFFATHLGPAPAA